MARADVFIIQKSSLEVILHCYQEVLFPWECEKIWGITPHRSFILIKSWLWKFEDIGSWGSHAVNSVMGASCPHTPRLTSSKSTLSSQVRCWQACIIQITWSLFFFFNNEEICTHHHCNQWLELNTVERVMSLSWILLFLKISPWSFRCSASGSHCFRKICESIRVYGVPSTSELFLLLQSHVYFLSSILRQYKDRLLHCSVTLMQGYPVVHCSPSWKIIKHRGHSSPSLWPGFYSAIQGAWQ